METAEPTLGWRDQYRDLWTRLGALALGPTPPPTEQIVEEIRALLRDHAIQACGGVLTRAAERTGTTGRRQLREARGWLIRLTDMRRRLNAQPVRMWRVPTVRPGPDGQAWLPVPESALELVTAGPVRVTVEPAGERQRRPGSSRCRGGR